MHMSTLKYKSSVIGYEMQSDDYMNTLKSLVQT